MTNEIKELIALTHEALKHSYAPYSKFRVAATIITEDGHRFTGVNVENAGHSMAICAESSAICNMVAAGGRKIKEIVVLASSEELCTPCGACRQRIFEFSTPKTKVYMCNKNGILQTQTINALLPLAFTLNPDFGQKND